MPLKLYYGHNIDAPISISDADQMTRELDRIDQESRAADEPWMVALLDEAGRELALGVGADISVITWTDEDDKELPYLISHGASQDGEEDLEFYYGQWSEFEPLAAVPVEVARKAAREFLQTGARPDSVDWQT